MSTDAILADLVAGQLGPKHLGRLVHVHTSPPVFGRLEAIDRPRQGVRTLTLGGHRHRDVPSTCVVQVVTKEAGE